jgi:hypothetical protein
VTALFARINLGSHVAISFVEIASSPPSLMLKEKAAPRKDEIFNWLLILSQNKSKPKWPVSDPGSSPG